jgi:hypothetical protein
MLQLVRETRLVWSELAELARLIPANNYVGADGCPGEGFDRFADGRREALTSR